MSEPAIFVLIRDGQKRYFADRWANAYLHREIVWGPEALEAWLTESEEIDDWSDEACGGVVVDYDSRRMVWNGDDGIIGVPCVANVYNRLLQAAWPGFDVQFADRGLMDLAAAAGESDAEDYDDETPERCSTVREAVGIYSDEDEEEYEDTYEEDDERAWITLIDTEGAVRHRNLSEVSEDLIHGHESALEQIAKLPPAEIPEEAVVTEGMWIDQPNRTVGYWGGRNGRVAFEKMSRSWDGWNVHWADGGYSDQCAVSGPAGVPMSEAEALGKVIPSILSTKRFDMSTMFSAVGGQLKKSAIKATGCLTLLMCAPVLLYGAISGSWQAALITVGIVVLLVAIVFKVVEYKFKRKFALPELQQNEEEDPDSRPPVAGPLDDNDRNGVWGTARCGWTTNVG